MLDQHIKANAALVVEQLGPLSQIDFGYNVESVQLDTYRAARPDPLRVKSQFVIRQSTGPAQECSERSPEIAD